MKLGARDYIIKDTNLLDLLPTVIGRVVKEVENELKLKRAQEELKESEEKFRILFADNPQPMFVYNLSTLSILEVNQTALNFYGYTKDECLKMTIKELHPSEDIQSFLDMMEQTKMGINTDGITKHIKKNGEVIIVEIFSAPANFLGENARLALVVDITERKKMEEAIKFLITCGVTSSGEDFFESLAKYLSQLLDMEYVCIDKLDPDGLTAHTLANYNEGTFDSNISYTLHQTPCGEDVGKNICCFPENVCKLFPNDNMLVNMNAESYVGTTLWSFDGKPIGLIAIIGRKPLKNRIMAENILRMVSVRAAGELERKKAEEALIKKVNELSYMNKFMVNREVRMAEMKKEINEMLVSVGKEKRYL
jgi:PAS domain S-box-containing protein